MGSNICHRNNLTSYSQRQQLMLAVSNGEEAYSCINSMSSWDSEVDPAIRRHGEPHVVRVGVVSILIPRVHQQIFLISIASDFCEYLEVMVGSSVTSATEYSSMNEDFISTGGNHTGNGEGRGGSMSKIWRSHCSERNWSPVEAVVALLHTRSRSGNSAHLIQESF